MNVQTTISTQQNKKIKFPIGAIFLTLTCALDLLPNISRIFTFSITYLLIEICLIALCVTLYVKKPKLAIIPAGVLAILDVISGIANLIDITHILAFASIALLSLSHTIDLQKFKKLLVTVLCISVLITAFGIAYISLTDFGIFPSFHSLLSGLPYDIGLILTGLWLANPYKKERPVVPARTVTKNENTGETTETYETSEYYTSLGLHIVLLLCTFGIWQLIWIYKATRFTNQAKGEEMRNPTNQLLLCMFIPFYSLIWIYKTATRIDKIAKEKGVSSELATICLILAFFIGVVPPILMQEKINSIITSGNIQKEAESQKKDELSGIDAIEKYQNLLDKGIITQEEFDIKKKELLGL